MKRVFYLFLKNYGIYPVILVVMLLSCVPPRQVTEQPALPALSVIPRPVSGETRTGYFSLPPDLRILYTDSTLEFSAKYLQDFIQSQTSSVVEITFKGQKQHDNNAVILSLDKNIEHPEGYRLQVNQNIQIQG